ncbi:MFS transporter [Phytoactinopolyspora halotolerans]|uniref:MFS transporter n=1 Tax=Phytoactinopolyspora halotolerans TaxID=1981512 RepID=A0A6L9SDK9_9ACTN|nr:MFS transporter [Phytoactinopolyspora halotolerans]NEE02581.1 MFS transporter [Phytoactinopolyspora halotolerans]
MTHEITYRAGRREWLGLAVLVLPALLASMDLSVLFMAVPWLSADLEPSGTQLLWIMDIYGFFIAGLLLTMGTLGDRIGRRKLLMFGAVAFGAASLLAAYSTSADMLIIARALLGVGGATLAPSTLALIRNMFHDDAERRRAVAIWTGSFSAGFPLGSIIGGLLVERFWWGSVFLINIPVMVALLVLAPVLLPEYKDPRPGRFDLSGAALAMGAVLAAIWGLKELAEYGWEPVPALAIVVGVLLGYLFVRRQRSRPDPLLDVGLFRFPAFSASIGVNLILVLASAGVGMLVVQHMQLVMGYRPVVAALWMLPMVAVMMVGISLGTVAVRWIRPGLVVGAGLAVAAVGFGSLTQLSAGDSIATLITGYSVLGFGMGTALSMAYNMVIATAPAENAGAAAAVNETGSELGGALGIATLGSIASAVYSNEIRDALPQNLSPEAADTAGGTLGGAVAIAEELPSSSATVLVQQAQDAFVHGINTTALVGAATLAVAAVVVTVLLRRTPLPEAQPAER